MIIYGMTRKDLINMTQVDSEIRNSLSMKKV